MSRTRRGALCVIFRFFHYTTCILGYNTRNNRKNRNYFVHNYAILSVGTRSTSIFQTALRLIEPPPIKNA